MIPQAHQLSNQSSAFVDSGVHLDLLARSPSNYLSQHQLAGENDDVFSPDSPDDGHVATPTSSFDSTSSSNTTVITDQSNATSNGLCRSRRSHFSRKDSTPEMANKTKNDSELCNTCQMRTSNNSMYVQILDEQRIVHSMKSLWWFYQNLPLCKSQPHNFDKIRELVPGIIRDKVNDFMSIINRLNGNVNTNINWNNRVVYQNGSGRIAKSAFSSCMPYYSKSFDESGDKKHENNSFNRSASTIGLNTLRESDA